jgi:tripartite-type tricarboxylate transporter receptor subunit TctC
LIENKPGAGGAIASVDVARSPADGYTLLMAAAGFVIAPAVLPKAGYDPVKDFVGVRQLAIVPLIIVTRSDSKLENINDLLELARKDGDKVTFASFGNATPAHLAGRKCHHRYFGCCLDTTLSSTREVEGFGGNGPKTFASLT